MNLSFHGAAGTVTGSKHLLRADGLSVLIDAGLFQGLKELRLLNWQPPAFDPASVDQLILTHAHIDHSGYIPRLVNAGFSGPIHCTPATAELAGILLRDAGHLQEEDAAFANKKRLSKHTPALPLFTVEDAERALERFRPVGYSTLIPLARGIRARFLNAGHLLGSAFVEFRVDGGKGERAIVFSGDVGRYDMSLHSDPDARPACDVLVVESTYGDRIHDDTPLDRQLAGPLRDVLEKGGIVLIPSFAVGRVQQVVLLINELMERGEIPRVPVDVNSPMAFDASAIYLRHLGDRGLDTDLGVPGKSRLYPSNLRFHRTVAESKALVNEPGPRIIISASGMLTGGRVLHHLVRSLPDPKNMILFVGFQAPGTRGRALLDGAASVRIHGAEVEVRARLLTAQGLSGHADSNELMLWMKSAGTSVPRHVFLVHGEPPASEALARRIEAEMGSRTHLPKLGNAFDLDALLS